VQGENWRGGRNRGSRGERTAEKVKARGRTSSSLRANRAGQRNEAAVAQGPAQVSDRARDRAWTTAFARRDAAHVGPFFDFADDVIEARSTARHRAATALGDVASARFVDGTMPIRWRVPTIVIVGAPIVRGAELFARA